MPNYIILRNSVEQAAWEAFTSGEKLIASNFQGKKFHITLQDYSPGDRKSGSEDETLGGTIDLSIGWIFWQMAGVIRIAHTPSGSEIIEKWGSLSELQAYFRKNNPTATPSNVITLVDFDGVEHDGFLRGNFLPRPMTTYITGLYAHFLVPFQFIEKVAATS